MLSSSAARVWVSVDASCWRSCSSCSASRLALCSASIRSLVASAASSVALTKYSITAVTAAIAMPTPVVISNPRSAILKAVALYAPLLREALNTRTIAADDLLLSPNEVITTLPSLARAATKVCCILSCLNVVIRMAALEVVLSSPAEKSM